MSVISAQFLHPAYKVEVKDVLGAKGNMEEGWRLSINSHSLLSSSSSSSSREDQKLKNIPFKQLELNLALIWIQGNVVEFFEEEDSGESISSIEINDGTGTAVIYDYKGLPGADHPGIIKGAYIGVLGRIHSNDPTVIIKGSKIMYLDGNKIFNSLWPEEIKTDRAFLLGLLEPQLD